MKFKRADIIGITIVYAIAVIPEVIMMNSLTEASINAMDATFLFLIPAFLHNYRIITFFDKKRYFIYFLLIMVWMLALSCLIYGFDRYIGYLGKNRTFSECIRDMFVAYILIIGTLFLYRVWRRSRESVRIKTELKEMELKANTLYIHPHFLFNTLNALYNMALKNDVGLPASIVKLSELMRYLLDSGNKKQILLQLELDCIENYIELEKIRTGNRVDILFSVEGEYLSQNIAPMLLLPFIENAFKHGVGRKEHCGRVHIEILFDIQPKKLFMHVSNTKPHQKMKQEYVCGGTGLPNVRRRLDLLYPQKHELQIIDTEENYEVLLSLEL